MCTFSVVAYLPGSNGFVYNYSCPACLPGGIWGSECNTASAGRVAGGARVPGHVPTGQASVRCSLSCVAMEGRPRLWMPVCQMLCVLVVPAYGLVR